MFWTLCHSVPVPVVEPALGVDCRFHLALAAARNSWLTCLIAVDYGVILKVKPTLQGHDRVQNEVTIEVSMPVATAGTQFTLQKYNTTCTAVCKVGESMVISGMTQTISTGNSSKTPLLGDVPILELFFSNKTSDKERHEFVIVVTPQPVFPTEATGAPLGEQHKQLLQDSGKDSKE